MEGSKVHLFPLARYHGVDSNDARFCNIADIARLIGWGPDNYVTAIDTSLTTSVSSASFSCEESTIGPARYFHIRFHFITCLLQSAAILEGF